MNLKSAFALLAAGTFLVACGADEVVNVNDEAKDKATITLKVMDNHDGSAVEEAEVYSIVDDKTVKTDEFGLSTWKKQVLGNHAFQISKEGYATILTQVTLDEQGQGNVARVGDVIAPIYMYKTGVTASGTVLYTNDKGNREAAAEVTVYATLPKVFGPSELSTKTDKNGEYKFENLPEGVEIDITVGQATFDKKNYAIVGETTIGGSTYRAGDAIKVPLISMSKVAGQLVLVSSNLDKIDSNSSITLTFSAELVADSVKASKWTVEDGNGRDQMVSVSLGSDKKSITIKLIDGFWSKTSTYYVEGYAYSTEGASVEVNKNFKVGASGAGAVPENVTLKATADEDYPETRVVLTWTAPKGAVSGYTLWYKNVTQKMSAYEVVNSSYYTLSTLDSKMTVRLTYLGEEGDKLSFKLIPYNTNGTADVTKAKAVEYTIPTSEL